jgi:hypothetical protein
VTIFRDLPAECFPFTVEYHSKTTGELLQRDVISGPGMLRVPALGRLGHQVAVTVRWGDGAITSG